MDKSEREAQMKAKAAKKMGVTVESTAKAHYAGSSQSRGSIIAAAPLPEEHFIDEQTIPINRTFKPLAQFATTQLLKDRAVVSQTQYEKNLASFNVTEISSQPLSIQTKDGAKISALQIGNPDAEQCLIVFQPKDGNFKDFSTLEKLFKLADETGARVIAFNYRDKPASLDSLNYDGCAVTQYAMRENGGTAANKITFYGESLGGAIASETAGKLVDDENKEVKIICGRAPNSLADAVKHMDVDQLLSVNSDPNIQKDLKALKTIQKLPGLALKAGVKLLFGRDLNTEKSLEKLPADNVVRFRVEGDAMATKESTESKRSARQILVGRTGRGVQDKHNAEPDKVYFPTSTDAKENNSKRSSGIKKDQTLKDIIVEQVKRVIQPTQRPWKT